jgi:preprotein translocase subunit SecD
MSSLRTLLQIADPIRHEAPRLDAERERIRIAILGATPADRLARFLTARLTLVAVLAMIAIAVVTLGYEMWAHGTTPVLAAVRFEVRLAEDRPIAGLVVAQVPNSDRILYVHPEIVVGNDDVAQTWVVQDDSSWFAVAVQLLPSGAERMRQATATHVGRPVAILIDGAVVMAPVVRSPITDTAVITGHFTQAEAQRIADGVGRR